MVRERQGTGKGRPGTEELDVRVCVVTARRSRLAERQSSGGRGPRAQRRAVGRPQCPVLVGGEGQGGGVWRGEGTYSEAGAWWGSSADLFSLIQEWANWPSVCPVLEGGFSEKLKAQHRSI